MMGEYVFLNPKTKIGTLRIVPDDLQGVDEAGLEMSRAEQTWVR